MLITTHTHTHTLTRHHCDIDGVLSNCAIVPCHSYLELIESLDKLGGGGEQKGREVSPGMHAYNHW